MKYPQKSGLITFRSFFWGEKDSYPTHIPFWIPDPKLNHSSCFHFQEASFDPCNVLHFYRYAIHIEFKTSCLRFVGYEYLGIICSPFCFRFVSDFFVASALNVMLVWKLFEFFGPWTFKKRWKKKYTLNCMKINIFNV